MKPVTEPGRAYNLPAKCHSPRYSLAVIDDCLDDYALLTFLLRRSNIYLKDITHYDCLSEMLQQHARAHDIIFVKQRRRSDKIIDAQLQELSKHHNSCSVFLQSPPQDPASNQKTALGGTIGVLECGSLDQQALDAVIAAAALVGPNISLQ